MRGKQPDLPLAHSPKRSHWGPWLFGVCFAGLLFLLASLALSNRVLSHKLRWMPVTLHSLLQADYGADQQVGRFAPAKLSLVLDVLRDTSAIDSAARFATLQARLNIPVPSITPALGGGSTGTATHTATSTVVSKPTATQPAGRLPTSTQTPSLTATLTTTSWRPPITTNPPTHTPKPDRDPKPTDPPPTQPPPTQPPPTQPPPTKTLEPRPTQLKSTVPYPPPYP